MYIKHTVYVRCCHCGTKVVEEFVPGPTDGPGFAYERARARAKEAGWHMGEFKVCPPCKKAWDESDDITTVIIKEIIAEEKAGI